jgi:hypothetical protein
VSREFTTANPKELIGYQFYLQLTAVTQYLLKPSHPCPHFLKGNLRIPMAMEFRFFLRTG